MANPSTARDKDVADIACQILDAHRSRHRVHLVQELAKAKRLLDTFQPRDMFERERLEVLEGVMEYLESPIMDRVRAAQHLLEQLANLDAAPMSRRQCLPA